MDERDPPTSPESVEWNTNAHVQRWQEGDRRAFERLHERYAELLRIRVSGHRVWPLLARHHQLDDVVQEVWLGVAESSGTTFTSEGAGSFYAWLGRLTDNKVIDLLRVATAQKRGQGDRGEPLCTDHHERVRPRPGLAAVQTPTSRARVSELEEIARQELTSREYLAWDLLEVQGYSSQDAGFAMDCSDRIESGKPASPIQPLAEWQDHEFMVEDQCSGNLELLRKGVSPYRGGYTNIWRDEASPEDPLTQAEVEFVRSLVTVTGAGEDFDKSCIEVRGGDEHGSLYGRLKGVELNRLGSSELGRHLAGMAVYNFHSAEIEFLTEK